MRIIGGKFKGRILKSFDGDAVRPTSDRAREALFNVLQFSIIGTSFLDGFAGSGAVGLEAISRGAGKVVFTDSSKESCGIVKSNAAALGVNVNLHLVDCVEYLSKTDERFDVVFLDPPYASDAGERALKIIAERRTIDGGIVVIEKDREAGETAGLEKYAVKKYGKAVFTFFRLA